MPSHRAAQDPDFIEVLGSREHNLAVDKLEVPKRKLVVFTGVSGSGKSSLAFDTLYAEGQRRYVETLSAYARQFLGQLERPHVEHLRGLSRRGAGPARRPPQGPLPRALRRPPGPRVLARRGRRRRAPPRRGPRAR